MANKGYNILFILTDQERFFDEYPDGVKRPALARLQREGVTFENHQIAAAVCTPSRSTIYTGQHIVQTEMFDNTNFPWQKDMSTEIPTMGDRLRTADYYTAYKGKWHLSAGFEQTLDYSARPLSMEDYGFSDYFGLGDVIGMEQGGYRYDTLTGSQAIQWLRSQGEVCRQKAQPWLLAANLVNPHDIMFFSSDLPRQAQQEKRHFFPIRGAPPHQLYQQVYDLQLPQNLHQSLDEPGRPPAHENYMRIHDMWLGEIPANDEKRWKRYQDYYFNCLCDVDIQLKRLLEELDDLGISENTIVIYTSDHGELAGHHGLRGKGPTPYREQNNVPLIISHPEFGGGKRCKALSSHIDLLPTMIAMTKLDADKKAEIAEGLPGRDLTPLLDHPKEAAFDSVRPGALWLYNMFSYLDPEFMAQALKALKEKRKVTVKPDLGNIRGAVRSIADGRYRYSRYFSPRQHNKPGSLEEILQYNDIELYDLQSDVSEDDNLAKEPERHRGLIEEMNAKLNALIEDEVGEDIGQMLPESDSVGWSVETFDA